MDNIIIIIKCLNSERGGASRWTPRYPRIKRRRENNSTQRAHLPVDSKRHRHRIPLCEQRPGDIHLAHQPFSLRAAKRSIHRQSHSQRTPGFPGAGSDGPQHLLSSANATSRRRYSRSIYSHNLNIIDATNNLTVCSCLWRNVSTLRSEFPAGSREYRVARRSDYHLRLRCSRIRRWCSATSRPVGWIRLWRWTWSRCWRVWRNPDAR